VGEGGFAAELIMGGRGWEIGLAACNREARREQQETEVG
jgi:hypothetical protein